MKRKSLHLIPLALFIAFYSCKKDKDETRWYDYVIVSDLADTIGRIWEFKITNIKREEFDRSTMKNFWANYDVDETIGTVTLKKTGRMWGEFNMSKPVARILNIPKTTGSWEAFGKPEKCTIFNLGGRSITTEWYYLQSSEHNNHIALFSDYRDTADVRTILKFELYPKN